VPHISSSDLVRRADTNASTRLGAEISLLLDDYDDAIADFGGSLRPQDIDAFDYSCSGIVDAIDPGLEAVCMSS
jgi:hypothetical protein